MRADKRRIQTPFFGANRKSSSSSTPITPPHPHPHPPPTNTPPPPPTPPHLPPSSLSSGLSVSPDISGRIPFLG